MTLLEKLYWITDKYDGMGISYTTIARFSHCDPSTISNYISGKNKPTRRMEVLISKGIEEIARELNEKILKEE